MGNRARCLAISVALAALTAAGTATAAGLCEPGSGRLCPEAARIGASRLAAVELAAPVPGLRVDRPRLLLAFAPSPRPGSIAGRLWEIVRRGLTVETQVRPGVPDGPSLPARRRGFQVAMAGVRVSFGERIATELWAEVVGIEMLDHTLALDGSFRPF